MPPRLRTIALALALPVAALAAAPAASADTASIPVPSYSAEVVASGDVLANSVVDANWATALSPNAPPDRGPITVQRRDLGGGTTTLASFSPPAGQLEYIVRVRISTAMWAIAIKFDRLAASSSQAPSEISEVIATGPIAGPATPNTIVSCTLPTPERDSAEQRLGLSVSDDAVAWADSACPGAGGVRIAPVAGGPSARVAGGDTAALALSPTRLTFFTHDVSGQDDLIEQVDRATGAATAIDADPISAYALDGDRLSAVVAFTDLQCADIDCPEGVMRVAADGTIQRSVLAPVDPQTGLVSGGGRVLAERPRGNGLVAVDLATGARSYAGALGLGAEGTQELAVDATRAAYLTTTCDLSLEVRFEATVAQAPGPLHTVPCPVRFLTHQATLHLSRGRTNITFSCANGCDSQWTARFHGRIVGTFVAAAPPGATRTASLQFLGVGRLFAHRRAVALTLQSGDRSYPFALQQAPVTLKLTIRP